MRVARKSKEPRWQYDFDCRKCANIKLDENGVDWCKIMKAGTQCIHADDDRHVRADYFKPKEEGDLR